MSLISQTFLWGQPHRVRMNMLYFLVPLPGSKHRKDVPTEAHDSPVILVGENHTDSHSEKLGYLLVTFLVTVTDRPSQSQKQFKGVKDFAHSVRRCSPSWHRKHGSWVKRSRSHHAHYGKKKSWCSGVFLLSFPLFLIIQGSCLYSECIFSRRLNLSVNTDTSRANSKSLQLTVQVNHHRSTPGQLNTTAYHF